MENRITGNGNTLSRILVTVGIAMVVTLSVALFYLYTDRPSEATVVVVDSAAVATQAPDASTSVEDQLSGQSSEEMNPAQKGMVIITDDPNEPPYGMIGIVNDNGQKLFTFGLPDGGFTEDNNDSTLSMTMPVSENTNLASSLFIVTLRPGKCTTEDAAMDSGTSNIAGIEFKKSELHDAGAGQYYDTYLYSFEKNDVCIAFSLQLHSSNAQVFDPPVNEFDLPEQIREFEKVLRTIKLF